MIAKKSILFILVAVILVVTAIYCSMFFIYRFSPQATHTTPAEEELFVEFETGSIRIQERNAGHETAIIFLHGFNGHLSVWDSVWEHIETCAHLVRLDLPGFGQSEWRGYDFSMETQSERLIALMDRLNIESVILVGASMGGSLAAITSAKYPERVEGLILLAPSGYPGALQINEVTAYLKESWLSHSLVRLLTHNPLFKTLFPDSKYIQAVSATGSYGENWKNTAKLSAAPTVLFWSRGDKGVPYKFAEATASLFKYHSLVSLHPSAGHNLPRSRGKLIAKAACEFSKSKQYDNFPNAVQSLLQESGDAS